MDTPTFKCLYVADTVESVVVLGKKSGVYTIYSFDSHTYLWHTIFMTTPTNDVGYSLV